jgi:hypothetical protein
MVTSWNDPDEATQVFDSERTSGAAGGERWYISPDGRTKEVLEAREIIERARVGALSPSTLVWRDGLSDWTRLDAVPELMQAVRAFRASSTADPDSSAQTLIWEEGISANPDVSRDAAGKRAPTTSLPPLPALPAVPGGANGSPRAPSQTLSGAPLPPLPALPPLGARKSVPDTDVDPPTQAMQAISAPASSQRASSHRAASHAAAAPGAMSQAVSVVKERLNAAVVQARVWSDKARPVVIEWARRANVYLERDYVLPKVGKVSGRLIAAVGAGVVFVVVLIAAFAGGGESPAELTDLARDAKSTLASQGASEESGVDLDQAAKPEAVSLAELKSLRPGEKAPAVTKEGISRGTQVTTSQGLDVYAAKTAFTTAATKAAQCKSGPKGEGTVRIKIAPSGKVSSVNLTTPEFKGSAAEACIVQAFQQTTVPPFTGEETTVFKKFTIL